MFHSPGVGTSPNMSPRTFDDTVSSARKCGANSTCLAALLGERQGVTLDEGSLGGPPFKRKCIPQNSLEQRDQLPSVHVHVAGEVGHVEVEELLHKAMALLSKAKGASLKEGGPPSNG